jgi:hypothetical protein
MTDLLSRLPHASESTRKLNPGLFGQGLAKAKAAEAVQPAPKRLKQRRGPQMNKLEEAFLEQLRAIHKGAKIYVQAFAIRLANGCVYWPDFVVIVEASDGLCRSIVYEVKGPVMRDDAAVKLKVAASLFPHLHFILASRASRTSPWELEEIVS